MTHATRDGIAGMLPRLRAFARSLARNPDAADDLVQTTCERALRAASTFKPGTRLDSWLFRIMHNAWIDGHRKASHQPQADLDMSEIAVEDGRRTTEARLMLTGVRQAIGRLPEDQRAVLVLVCVEDLSYRETAAVLGIPIGTVMSRLARARAALIASMESERPAATAGRQGR